MQYNFEHEDITFPALMNHQMINSIIEFLPNMWPIIQVAASVYVAWHLIHIIHLPAVAEQLWKLLTPNQQYSEIVYIASSLLVAASALYVCLSMLWSIERHMTRLKEQRKELQSHIEELERENEEMKNTFRMMVSYANPNIMQRKRLKNF